MSCVSCGSRPARAGEDALGFLSGPHALHHAVAIVRLENDDLVGLTCCCGSLLEVRLDYLDAQVETLEHGAIGLHEIDARLEALEEERDRLVTKINALKHDEEAVADPDEVEGGDFPAPETKTKKPKKARKK